jgi:hypothetical protein
MSQQQTVLRVETNIVDFVYEAVIPLPPYTQDKNQYKFTTLDLYGDIPIKINKSIAEIQDISKRNSDLSIGLTLPGSKKNNRFFEMFYNVDTQSLYFDPTKRVNCDVLLDDQSYFKGYLRLNKINVLNSKVEYDVTLYSTVGNLFGEIGNNLLQDLDFDDTEYTFNHTFTTTGVTTLFGASNFYKDSEYPYTYFYPVVHNGYEYSGNTINFSGITSGQTRLYTSTSPIGSFPTYTAATSAGVEEYRINSPLYGLRDNQLKPALNIWSLIKLIFKTYGYTIKSDFMNTPWIKSLYLYGYFSYEGTKFGWKINNIQELPLDGVEVYYGSGSLGIPGKAVVVKRGTGIPCYCTEDISVTVPLFPALVVEQGTILAGTTGFTYSYTGTGANPDFPTAYGPNGEVVGRSLRLSYNPKSVGDSAQYSNGDAVSFDLVIDQNIKQIDLLSSIAKKFNLVFIPDPEITNQIIVEPYDYYIGTGQIFDWTPMLSWDKGFTVEPAQNFIESSLLLTDLEDGDEGNREFKNRVNRIYGRNIVYNPTDFKSQEKKIDTIFSPQLIRRWDDNIGLPLGINYSATSDIDKVDNQVRWSYKGVKTKPKLFYWVGTANPFIDDVNEVYSTTGTSVNTYTVKVQPSNFTGVTTVGEERIPVVSHTMPLGLADNEKINNDSLSILFNSELPVDIGVQTYNTYTENDTYNTFYRTRINNIYNPNTRIVSGYFDLKYSDIQNFQWNDVIKINEQYFTINKISEFNLTNRELTKVELIQLNLNPQDYVDRYFKYTYCDQPGYCFKLKTDFTNPNLQDTNFIWSTYYDQQVGSLTGTTTGFTSTFRIFNTGSFQEQYVPYTMQEISETDYISGSCFDSNICDPMLNYIYANPNGLNYSLASFWENTAGTFTGTNLWSNCAGFNATNSTYVITTGSSTTYGINACLATPTPTPTPTASSTPTPTPTATPTPTPTPSPTPPVSVWYQLTNCDTFETAYSEEYFEGQFAINERVTTPGSNTWVITGWIYTNPGGTLLAITYTGQFDCPSTTGFSGNIVFANLGSVDYTNSEIYKSTDYGANYSSIYTYTGSQVTREISIDNSGTYVLTYTNDTLNQPKFYQSTDSGSTFTRIGTIVPTYFVDTSMSSNGRYRFLTYSYNQAQYSSDYGVNYTNVAPNISTDPSLTLLNSQISKNGNLLAVIRSESSGFNLYTSINSGTTWTNKYSFTGITLDALSQNLKVSNSGKYIYLRTFENKIFYSSDSGTTFNVVTLPTLGARQEYVDWCISQTGKYVYVTWKELPLTGFGPLVGGMYRSNNFGVSYSSVATPIIINYISTNNDGSIVIGNTFERYGSPEDGTKSVLCYSYDYGNTFTKTETYFIENYQFSTAAIAINPKL